MRVLVDYPPAIVAFGEKVGWVFDLLTLRCLAIGVDAAGRRLRCVSQVRF